MRRRDDDINPTMAPPEDREARSSEAAQLIVIGGAEVGLIYPLDSEQEQTLGRSSNARITVADERVSRVHARLRWASSDWVVEDLGSLNGTFVNDERVERAVVRIGDRLRLGDDLELLFTREDGVRDELLQRQRFEAIGRLSLGIAHDFNNMLATMSATLDYLDQISLEALDPGEYQSCLRDMQVAVDRSTQLAARLLRSGRSTAGRPERVDLAKITEEVVQLARRSFPRRITIKPQIDPGLHVLGDAVALQQVLMNLMVNARDAMPEEGKLGVTVRRRRAGESQRVVIEVADTGIGMSEEVRERMFEPHFTTKSEGQGFGLGLATARSLIERQGGQIEVESEPGHGSRFRISLPMVSSRQSGRTCTQQNDLHGRAMAKLRVLLADDEVVLRRSLKRILVGAGFRVEEVGDGASAVERVCATDGVIDLAILDVDMPGMDGVEACRVISERSPNTPVVILTGHDEATLRASLREAGAMAVVSKPVSADRLVTTINTAYDLGRRRAAGLTTLVTVA